MTLPKLKLIHAADLHVDSPLRGLSRYEGAPVQELRNATRRALENLVGLCIEERAALLLLAGDLFDGDWRDYSTGLFFASQMARLQQASVRVVTLRGNHDAQSQITKQLRMPDNVRELSTRKPETVIFEDLGVAVHGQSYARRAVTEDLAAGYPAPIGSLLNIGLLHTSLTGRPGHEPYAPTTLDVLRGKGYDYWALGHVHAREVVSEDPWVVFPGNLQGRHARETGAKGATVIEVQEGRIRGARHEVLDAVRYAVCEVDASVAASLDDVLDLVQRQLGRSASEAGGRLLCARVVLRGSTRAHVELARDEERLRAEIERCALSVAEGMVWLERVELATRGLLDAARLAERDDAMGQLAGALHGLARDSVALGKLCVPVFEELGRKLPDEAKKGDGGLRLDDPEFFAKLLPEVRELLLARLLDGEGA
ncbi:MAG: exonuclease SbcCD subunit D [Polyangiales bacterium]